MLAILSHLNLVRMLWLWMSVSVSSQLYVILTLPLAQVVAGPLAVAILQVVTDSCETSPYLFFVV